MKKLSILLVLFAMSLFSSAQTPGLILTDAGTGATILDPDGDGYVSQKTDGVQIGFTNPPNSDVSQSEIPYIPIVTSDPTDDLEQGRACHFSEIVGDASPDQYAALTYWDSPNDAMLFRLRVAYFISNSKAYSVLIDTDAKFGFTGPDADPNAVPGNPGFEIEVVLMTNHGVDLYDVDGTTNPSLVESNSYANNAQKSIAVSNYCGDPDYFFDFFVTMTSFSSFGIDEDTPLRFAVVSNMNPSVSIGSNSMSDVGGDCAGGSFDAKFICVIESQTPTPPSGINTGIEERSLCPPIDAIQTADTIITGTTTEADNTVIEVAIYQALVDTLLATGTTTASGGVWTLDLDSISPAVTLAEGMIARATATAPGKGISADDCDEEVVDNCETLTDPPLPSEIAIIGGDKGYRITVDRPIGTKIYLYNSDGTLFDTGVLKSGSTNPIVTTTQPQTVEFACQTGQCFERAIGSSVYRFVFQEPGICDSYELLDCYYTSGTSTAPTIDQSTITESTSTISGNGNSEDAEIVLYVNGDIVDSYTTGTSPFAYSFSVSGLELGDSITVSQIETGKCYASTVMYVTREAYFPNITTPDCNASYPITSVSGTSVEATGSTITVYKLNPTRSSLGTTTVQADGTWTKTSLSLSSGDEITAAVTAGIDLTESIDGDTITLTTQSDISSYTVGITTPTDGDTQVDGTISGGTYPVTVYVYADSTFLLGSDAVAGAGAWSVTGIPSYDIATGSEISVRIAQAGECLSLESTTIATVICSSPNAVTITSSVQSFCDGTYGEITVQSSEAGIYYEPILVSDSSTFGYGRMGDGSNITLTTYQITDTVEVSILASKFPIGSCDIIVSDTIEFTPGLLPVAPIAPATQYYCGADTLGSLVVNVPEETSIKWYNASSGGAELPLSTALVDDATYYVEAICDTNSCTSTNRTAVLVDQGDPIPPTAAAEQTTCYVSTLEDIDVNVQGPGTMVWYSVATGGSALPINTPLVDGVTYYVEIINGACTSASRTSIEITLGMVTDTTSWTGAVSNDWTDDDNWTDGQPSVCTHVVICDPSGAIDYPIISGPAACKSITFEPGGGVLGLEQLTYEKAYVQLENQRKKWYTITPPLKETYAADYSFQGHPVAILRLFDEINPDSLYLGGALNTGTWSRGFSTPDYMLTPGVGFAYYIDDKTFNYPNPMTFEMSDITNYLPREQGDTLRDVVYMFSTYSGYLYTNDPISLPKVDSLAYRFAMEDSTGTLVDPKFPIKTGLNLIGNPMMCHLDFNALYSSNSGVIANKVKFWNGTTFTTFMAGADISSDLDLSDTSIAPMQAFFVEGLIEDTLTVDLSAHYITDEITKLRSAGIISNTMHIKASNGIKESSTAIALRNSGVSNACGQDDAFKLFSQYNDVPEIYTLSEEVALDINQFNKLPYMTPLGIKSSKEGSINLSFNGADSFDSVEVTLMNTKTGEQQNLKSLGEYTLEHDGTSSDGYLFVEFRSAQVSTDIKEADHCEGNRCIQVYQKDKNTIGIISPPSDKIQNVTIWEKSGRMLYSKYNVKHSELEAKVVAANQTCVVRVATEYKSYVIKLIMQQ